MLCPRLYSALICLLASLNVFADTLSALGPVQNKYTFTEQTDNGSPVTLNFYLSDMLQNRNQLVTIHSNSITSDFTLTPSQVQIFETSRDTPSTSPLSSEAFALSHQMGTLLLVLHYMSQTNTTVTNTTVTSSSNTLSVSIDSGSLHNFTATTEYTSNTNTNLYYRLEKPSFKSTVAYKMNGRKLWSKTFELEVSTHKVSCKPTTKISLDDRDDPEDRDKNRCGLLVFLYSLCSSCKTRSSASDEKKPLLNSRHQGRRQTLQGLYLDSQIQLFNHHIQHDNNFLGY